MARVAALAAVGFARVEGTRRWARAFPSVDHPASNAVCRRAGFAFLGEVDFEYPTGRPMRCNDWGVEL